MSEAHFITIHVTVVEILQLDKVTRFLRPSVLRVKQSCFNGEKRNSKDITEFGWFPLIAAVIMKMEKTTNVFPASYHN